MNCNVLHLLASVGKGGAEVLLFDLLKHCQKNHRDSIQLLFFGEGDLKEDYISSGLAVQKKTRNFFRRLQVIRKHVKSERIGILHCHGPVHLLYAFIATLGLKTKLILTSHGFKNSFSSRWLLKTAICFSDKVLFVSEAFKIRFLSILKKKDREKYIVLYNGVDHEKITVNIKNSRKGKDNSLALGMTGNFYNDGRDQLTVCKAIHLLNKSQNICYLDFAGGASKGMDQYYRECQEFVNLNKLSGTIKFLGFRDDALDLLQKWDAFVYSSNRDSFGIAVVEALMSGIPVFVNDLDVFDEITENGKYATLYKTKDFDDLAAKILNFMEDPARYLEKAQKAAGYAREKFTIEKHYQNLDQIYNSLLSSES